MTIVKKTRNYAVLAMMTVYATRICYGIAQAQHRTCSHSHNYVRQTNLLKSGHCTHFYCDSSCLQSGDQDLRLKLVPRPPFASFSLQVIV